MARYTGPKVKILRRFDTDLPGLTRKTKGEKKNPPGQHGASARRRDGDYAIRLIEKQKVRFNYGITEKQLRKYYKKAYRSKQDTGHQMLTFLESRLDNVVFRAGFAPTIPAARQLVSHGHVLLNGHRCDRPSTMVRVEDVLSIKESSRENLLISSTLADPAIAVPTYLNVVANDFSATLQAIPSRDDVPLDISENLIVEYYAKVS